MANKIKFRYGICQNSHVEETGKPCPLCQSKEVQRVIATKELICSECKGKLKEIPRPKTFWEKYGTLIIAAVALLIIGGGVACYTLVGGSDEPTGIKHEEKVTIEEPEATPPPTQQMLIKQLSIDGGDFSIKVGESKQLTFVVDPEKHDEILSWVSDNETVATVDNTGKVSAMKEGTANIKVAADKSGVIASVKVTVTKESSTDGRSGTDGSTSIGKRGKEQTSGTIHLSYGKYTGQIVDGYPHGVGRLVYSASRLINKYDSKKRMAQPDESVQGTFVNGFFTVGKHYDSNGNLIDNINVGVVDGVYESK